MKIDLEMLEAMVASGATGAMVLAMVRLQFERHEAKRVKRRPVESSSKRRTRGGNKVDRGGNDADTGRMAKDSGARAARDEATLSDTPRARLFREAKPALLTLNISDSRAGALIVQWLKLTNDDDQLVLATILKAQALSVADAPGYILATLKGRINGNGTGAGPHPASNQSGSTAIIAGVAAATERRARERSAAGQQRPSPPDDHPAERSDPELFGAR